MTYGGASQRGVKSGGPPGQHSSSLLQADESMDGCGGGPSAPTSAVRNCPAPAQSGKRWSVCRSR